MENPRIINLMRNMAADTRIDLERLHQCYPNCTRLYRGRPEMVVMTMTNGRNVQLFRGGKIQILGCIPSAVAESMRDELIVKLRKVKSMETSQVSEMVISNMVMSAQLEKKVCLQNIASSSAILFHEIELFPAVLIRKWHPVHIAIFHNGKVILTGLKSEKEFHDITPLLSSFLQASNCFE